MRITILALGSRGDVQPYTALGKGLQDCGHRVRVVTFENFSSMVSAQGLDFSPIKGDAQAIVNSTAGVSMMGSGTNPIRMMRTIVQTFGKLIDDYIEGFSADALNDSEAIIDQLPASLFGYDLAEKLRVPHLIASVIPLEPTGAFPLSLLTTKSGGPLLNHLTYKVAQQMAWQPFRVGVNRFRKRLGLRPAPLTGNFGEMRRRHDPVINGFSRHVVPPPPDWASHVHTTGYWILEEPAWAPPVDLVGFLESGPAPIFIGFGSMPVPDPARTTQIILDALRISRQRVILSSGWANLGDDRASKDVFRLNYAPYSWLFPRMAAVIHHGGSGTTGLTLRAGVPSMIVPFTADQPYWGKRVIDLGVGANPIMFKSLTVENLARAIQQLVSDKSIAKQAADLGAKLRAEDGLSNAVEAINHYLPLFARAKTDKE